MKKIVILLVLTFLLLACSSIKELTNKQKEELVRTNLSYLNNFKSEGVLEVIIKGFSLKKEFVLKKRNDSLRLDVLDSGIMSLLPSPFATLYVKDEILLTNYNKGFFPDLILEKFPLKEFFDLDKLPQEIIDEIVDNRSFAIAFIQFQFDELYRLNKIMLNENVINFNYSSNNLIRIELNSSKADVRIDFDSFQTGDFLIKPLEMNKNKID